MRFPKTLWANGELRSLVWGVQPRLGWWRWTSAAAPAWPRRSTAASLTTTGSIFDGTGRTTRLLLDPIRPYGVGAKTILDIGGGIGAIDCELLATGAGHAVLVEASHAYLEVARLVAREANLKGRLELGYNGGVVTARWSKASISAPTLLTYASDPNAGQPVPSSAARCSSRSSPRAPRSRTPSGHGATASVGPRPV